MNSFLECGEKNKNKVFVVAKQDKIIYKSSEVAVSIKILRHRK